MFFINLISKNKGNALYPGGQINGCTVPWEEFTPEKTRIHYHRSYRKLEQHSMMYVLFSILLSVIAVDSFIVYYFSRITLLISKICQSVLSTCIPGELIQIAAKGYIYDNVYIVTLPGRYPPLTLSIVAAIISLMVIFLAASVKRAIEPKLIWAIFIFFILLASALFFIFFPGYFPYDIEIFSEMYIKTEVGIWLIIPFILTIALLPIRFNIIKKLLVILLTLMYSIVFACVRYIVFLYLLRTTTYLFMALMFFMLGPFLDFIYIVGSYSLCLSASGKQACKEHETWNWLY